MQTPDRFTTRHRLFAALAAAVVVLVLAGIGAYGLITGAPTSPQPGNDASSGPGPEVTEPADPAPTQTPRLPVVEASADPETFAHNVAEALFGWDTASRFMPLDYTSVILAVGDPSGAEQAGLAADIATYLPSREAWVELRHYGTTQHLTIEDVFVPQAWDTAMEQARPGQLAEGTVAYTIEGTRHRDGTWNGQPVNSQHPVTFTVFLVCAPSYDTCHLLRLSKLDNPLH
ncbi:MAG: hypothetical protein LCH98_15315 [Actinobacteria bacterium]|nr:hypothetical protein [Actinomycetota bacterium]